MFFQLAAVAKSGSDVAQAHDEPGTSLSSFAHGMSDENASTDRVDYATATTYDWREWGHLLQKDE